MADPILNEINLTTYKHIYPSVVEDHFFLDTPLQAHFRAKALAPFEGGSHVQHTFSYAPMIGGSYTRGDNFNITKRQTLGGMVFEPKFYQVSVPEFLEDLEINRGAAAVFNLVDLDMRNAMNTISENVAIAMNQHGRALTTGITSLNRENDLNGWLEALNDGVTPGWTGDYFTTYGGATRNGVIGSALNSVPYWNGTSGGATAPISYNVLEETYQDASRGAVEPDLGVTTKAGMAFVKERIQPQQRFSQERDPYFGASGFKMNSAMVLKDDYFPSATYGEARQGGNFLTSSFTSPGTVGATSNMPTSTALTVGELFCWFNTDKWIFRVSNSRLFGFGWTGFKPGQDNTRVVGQILANVNMECVAPWANKQIFGIGG
jgi:hypothetical protein